MYGLYKFLRLLFKTFYQLLDPNFNGLKNAPMQTKYIVSILLACFWALAFSLYAGEIWYLGYNVFGHMAIVSMAFITWLVIKTVQKQYPDRPRLEQLRQPDRAQRDYEMPEQERLALMTRSRE
jgi:hypothetical protein